MTTHKVTFTKSNKEIEVKEGQCLLDAGLEAGLDLQYGCMAGSCTACAVTVKGNIDQAEDFCLSPEEHEKGLALLCVGRAKGDLTIDA